MKKETHDLSKLNVRELDNSVSLWQ